MLFRFVFYVLNSLLEIIGLALNTVFKLFPPSPFQFLINSQYADVFAQVNYFIPIYEFIVIFEAYLVCVASFYAYSSWGRFVKAIN